MWLKSHAEGRGRRTSVEYKFKDSRTAGATQRNLVEGREGGREILKSLINFFALTHGKT